MIPRIEKIAVLIPAAGSGSRLGLGFSKGLLTIAGRTAIERVVEAVTESIPSAQIVILVPQAQRHLFEVLAFDSKSVAIVPGGETRQESVRAGVEYLAAQRMLAKDDIVVVHDAARCLVKPELFTAAVAAARRHGAVTTVVPLVDSIVQVDAEGVATAVSRSQFRAVQTPQAFLFDLLLQAHRQGVIGATDDASLVGTLHAVKVIEGENTNFKVTTPHDVERAEALLAVSARGSGS